MTPRLARTFLTALLATASVAACSDKSNGPDPVATATRTADRFDHMADSLSGAGNPEGSDVARGMAELIRAVGRVDLVSVSVDGQSASHMAIATELLTDASACDDTADPEFCHEFNPEFTQLVLGWRDFDLSEGFSIISEQVGTSSVAFDETFGLVPPVSVLYFKRDVYAQPDGPFAVPSDAWFAEQGTATTPAAVRGESCPSRSTDDVVPYPCYRAVFSPSFDVTASGLDPEGPAALRHLTMAAQRVDGLSVDVTDILDPSADPTASLGRLRPTASLAERRLRAVRVRGLLRRVAPAFGRGIVPR